MFQREQERIGDKFKEFFLRNKIPNPLSQGDLQGCMDKIVGGTFDREVIDQLFAQMEKDKDYKVSLIEFLRVYFEAEKVLTKKLEDSSNKIVQIRNEREEIRHKLNDSLKTEVVDYQGMMKGSKLMIQMMGVSNLMREMENQKYYIIMQFEEESYRSKVKKSNWQGILEFKDKVQFITSTPASKLTIYLINENEKDTKFCEAQITIGLSELQDQRNHEDTYVMLNNKGQKTQINISLNLQWYFSKVKYYSEGLQRWDVKMDEEEEKLLQIESTLRSLYDPLRKLEGTDFNQIEQRIAPQISSEKEKSKISAHQKLQIDLAQKENDQIDWTKYAKYTFFIYLLITIFVCFGQASFLDIGICMSFLSFMELNQLNKTKTRVYLMLILISILVNMIWLTVFDWKDFVGDQTSLARHQFPLRIISIIFQYLNIIFKGLVALVLFKLSNELAK